jgi:heat-inducible transcriptional repressor
MSEELNQREKTILRSIIYTFIQTAEPVGSRYISKRHDLGLSPATVRNVMSDLEFFGYIDHPHTSAGRVPTDKGYRFYVDTLMELDQLSNKELSTIQSHLQHNSEPDELLKEVSKLIGTISHQLGVVSSPQLSVGVFEKLELVSVSTTRLMVIISIRSGLVKTIMMEMHNEIQRSKLDEVSRMLNERLAGLTLKEIRSSFPERVKDMQNEETGLVRLFVESVNKLFDESSGHEKVHIGGTSSILLQPEFESAENFRGIIELLDNEDMIVHVLEKIDNASGPVKISIGSETKDEKLRDYSVVSSTYTMGGAKGKIGILGTKRMNYAKVIPIVDYVAKAISEMFNV